jgi:UDP-N-acetylglucosamine--N-acetylmuramyl-(pentapeptide) pyrophosphoryl-undecaprenol N-acetylglucosamine transferase
MRILFYAVNGLGLGHVTRLLAIAREIRKKAPSAAILFLTTSESNVIFKEGFPSVKIPSKNIVNDSGFNVNLHINIIHQTAWSVFSSFRPDVTAVDTFPHGFTHELDQVLRWEACRFVYIYRQRKDEKLSDDYFYSLLHRYDLILIPHEKDAPGVRAPKGIHTLFIGPLVIRDRNEIFLKEKVIRDFNFPAEKKLVLINLGGGGQDNLRDILFKLIREISSIPSVHPVIAQGSLMQYLPSGNYTVLNGYYPVCELYAAFDAVIAGCGYNTVNEVLYFQKPALFIPFEREVDDQFRRSGYLNDNGLGISIPADQFHTVREKLESLLHPDLAQKIAAAQKRLKLKNNAGRAASEIIRLAKQTGSKQR